MTHTFERRKLEVFFAMLTAGFVEVFGIRRA